MQNPELRASAAFDRWPHRWAVLAALSAVPLVIFGGSVTTLGAGMAVEGWLVAEGHFLLFFPVEKWLRDVGTFVEHSHRLAAILVGLFSIVTLVATLRSRTHGSRRAWFAAFALLAVCGQGALGGFRVLENSARLAFLHGALAQIVFAILCACALVLSAGWSRREQVQRKEAKRPYVLAWITASVVVAQVFLGAWYRHALRPSPDPESATLLAAHLVGALAASVMVIWLLLVLRGRAAAEPAFAKAARRLTLLLGVQLLLGLFAWAGYRPDTIAPLEWTLSVLHVLVGGLLLCQCVTTAMWCSPVRQPSAEAIVVRARMEGAL